MRVLVTGHNGYIGSVLVRMLGQSGHSVVGLDTNYFSQGSETFGRLHKPEESIDADIRKIDFSLKGIDAICHLAALSNDPMGEINEKLTEYINYKSTIALAKLAKKHNVRKFIFSSSCSVYGDSKNKELDEDSKVLPLTAYARSKVMSEEGLLDLASDDFSVTILRSATAYGISPNLRLDLVLNNLVYTAIETGRVQVKSDGRPWRPLVHIEDISRAFVSCADSSPKKINRQILNVGKQGENYMVKQIAEIVCSIIPNSKLEMGKSASPDARTYKVKFDKIRAMLPSFDPKWTLREGVVEVYKKMFAYVKKKKSLENTNFFRLKRLQELMRHGRIDEDLYWRPK